MNTASTLFTRISNFILEILIKISLHTFIDSTCIADTGQDRQLVHNKQPSSKTRGRQAGNFLTAL